MKRLFTLLILGLLFNFAFAQNITWQKQTGPYGGNVSRLVVHPTTFSVYALSGNNGLSLYRSADNGATWTLPTAAGLANGDGRYQYTDVEVLADGTLLVVANNDLHKSTDDGATWARINTGTSSSSNGFDGGQMVTKNAFSGTIYVAGQDATNSYKNTVFRSTNGGSTFTKGYANSNGYQITQISITANGDVYAIIGNVLMRSADDGVTFNAVTTPTDANNVSSLTATLDGSQLVMVTYASNMYTLASTVASPSTTWSTALTETGIADLNYGSNGAIRYSLDKTTMFLMDNQNNKFYSRTTGNWTSKNTTFITSNGEDGICFASKDVNTLYVGTTDIGVWKSINGGSGWIESDTGIESGYYNGIVTADDGSVIVAGERAFRSTDNGVSWTRISNVTSQGYYVFKANTGSPKPIVLLGQNGQASYSTTTSGASWSTITTPPSANNFISADGTKIYGIGGSGQLYYTSNQGTTWSAALVVTGTGWPTGSYYINSMAMDQLSNLFAYVYDYNTSSYKFFKVTPNSTTTPTTGAATAITLATIGVTSVNAMGFSNGTVYVTGYGGGTVLSSTSNQGTTWTQSTSAPSGYRIDSDPASNYFFITNSGSNGQNTVYLSRDGGSTYSSSIIAGPANNNYSNVYGYAINSSGVAFAGVSSSSIYKTTGTIVLPLAPSSLVNSGRATDRVTLRWIDNATNEDHFVVEQFNGSTYDSVGYAYNNEATGSKTYAEVKNLQAGTSYTFRVSAKNSAGSTSATPVTITTLAQCTTTIPDNRSWNGTIAASGTPSSATLTNINIKSLGNNFFSIPDVTNGTISTQSTTNSDTFFGCTNTYLSPNYPIEPNTDGSWDGSSTLTFKWISDNGVVPEITGTVTLTLNATDPAPAAPSSTTAYVYNNTSIEISWLSSAFETSYVVQRSLSNTFGTIDNTINVNYPSTSVVDNTGLVNGTTYYYRVSAKNATGTSAVSNTATITLTKPYFTLSGTTIESTLAYSTTGAIWGDFNNDGFDDIIMPALTFFGNIPAVPLVFKNDGAGNFVSVTPTGIVPSEYLVGTAADYDNDGNLDLFITADANQNFLYKGNGDFTFTLVSSTPLSTNYNVGTSQILDLGAAWADYNKDGLVDLFVATNDNTVTSKLFTQGPVGTFTLATTGGLQAIQVEGDVTAWADYDNDGDQDLFVTDGSGSGTAVNQLYKNNGDGTFTRVTGTPFDTDINERSFTASWGDYNNDGFLDLFVGARSNNLLYKNNGNGTFTKQSMPTSVTENLTNSNDQTFGSAWGDINNDGYQDLLVNIPNEENKIYINNAGTSFTKVNTEKFNDIKVGHFGLAFSDYNKDGLLDIAVGVIDPNLFGGGNIFGPTVKNQLFKNNSSVGNWVEVKLAATVSNRAAIGTRVTLVAGGKTQIREVTSSSSFCSKPSQVLHFGLGASTTITSIQIKWPSGITQTLTGPGANQIITVPEDGTPPAVVTLNPLNNATNVDVNTKVELTFNETFVAVAGKNISLTVHGSGSPAFTFSVTSGTIASNKISFTPSSALSFLTQYDVAADAGAFQDIYGNATTPITWSFTTLDNVPPVITFSAPATLDYKFSSTTFTPSASDNSGTVSSVTLSYRPVGGGTFTNLPGTLDVANSVWDFTVLETFLDGNGLEYYFTALDPANNQGRLPLDPATNFYTYKNYKAADNAIPSAQLGFGGTANSWKIFTIPFDLTAGNNNAISTVFDELSALTIKVDWRMLTYKNSTAWAEYPTDFSTFTRGQGYFINIKNPVSIFMPAAAASNNRKNLFPMALKKGWNEIGNPYLTSINWSDVVTLNALTGSATTLKTFASGSYTNATSLAPFEGGFVLADNDVNISIPFAGQTAPGGREKGTDFESGDWIVPITVDNGGYENNFGGVGMHSQASLSFDQFDDINAPRFINYNELNFPHPEHIAGEFARDVVPPQSEYMWQFTVESNLKGTTNLNWTTDYSIPKELYLYDIQREILVDMQATNSYSFPSSQSSLFRIYYGENLKSTIKPMGISLGEAYPNPTSGNVTIPFTLPDTNPSYQVTLEVYDIMGRKITTLVNGSLPPGFYSPLWEPVQVLNSGLYIYRMQVTNTGSTEVFNGKVIFEK